MLSKCANPACSTPLIYLREGKIFMMEHNSQPHARKNPVLVKHGNRVEHFWLCGPCSVTLTIAYDQERGVKVVPKPKPPKVVLKPPRATTAVAS